MSTAHVPPGKRWRFEVGGVALTVGQLAGGRWEVLYGGFSRVLSDTLEDAIAGAAAADPKEPWIGEISDRLARDPRYRRSVIASGPSGTGPSSRSARRSPVSAARVR
jgi:hypothetical protein